MNQIIRNTCQICGCSNYKVLTERRNMPVSCSHLYGTRDEALKVTRDDQIYVMCESCGFVWNMAFDDSIEIYDSHYNNSQTASPLFMNYMRSSIWFMMDNYDDTPQKVVEIGCGRNATYLSLIRDMVNCEAIGYDPSCLSDNPKLIIHKQYFDVENDNCDNDVDWLISRHSIEHISKPMLLFRNVTCLNRNNRKAIAFFETPDINWILKNDVVFDFSYEHCSLFNKSSFIKMAKSIGVYIDLLKTDFGDQYLWVFSSLNDKGVPYDIDKELETSLTLAESYKKDEEVIKDYICDFLRERKKDGGIAVWGAAGKGSTFLNLFDSKRELVDLLIDINREKWGKYTPGSGHEISEPIKKGSYSDNGINTVIIMNEQYEDEIKESISDPNVKVVTADGLCKMDR